jgi:DNA invertase Pin-like site-specific DNA recombinase
MNNLNNKIATYTRVSTIEQNIQRQEQNIIGKLYRDKISGRTAFSSRPKGKELLDDVKSGKINHIIFHTIDRASRNIVDIQNTINELIKIKYQVEIKDLNIKLLDDRGNLNLISKMIIDLLSNLANIDLNNSKERQKEGIQIARAKGNIYKGRKQGATMSNENYMKRHKDVSNLLKDGLSINKVSKLTGKAFVTVKKVNERLLLAS